MTVSKILISTAAAAALVGSIGLAYAQLSTPGSQPNQTQPSAQTEPSTTAVTPMSPSTGTSTMANERPAQADRN